MEDKEKSTASDTSPLVAAARCGQLAIVKQLVNQGHSVEARDNDGATALYWACCRGHQEVTRFLLAIGSDVNARVNSGATALLAAADNGQEGCVALLLAQKVDVNTSNHRGDTPLHAAAYRGHLNILLRLIEAGANPYLKNSARMTSLQEAISQHHKQCVSCLQQYMGVLPGLPGQIPLYKPALTSTSLSLGVACKSDTLKSHDCQEKMLSRRVSSCDNITTCSCRHPTTHDSTSRSVLAHSSMEPSGDHNLKTSLTLPCQRASSTDLPHVTNWSFSELAIEAESGILSYDSILNRAVPIHANRGWQDNNDRLTNSETSDFNHMNGFHNQGSANGQTAQISKPGYNENTPQQHDQVNNVHQSHLSSNTSKKLFYITEADSRASEQRLREAKGYFQAMSPAVAPSKESLQVLVQQQQGKISHLQAVIQQISEKLQIEQRENAELKAENSHLKNLFCQQNLFNLKTRGYSECAQNLAQSVTRLVEGRDGTKFSKRRAVESSDDNPP